MRYVQRQYTDGGTMRSYYAYLIFALLSALAELEFSRGYRAGLELLVGACGLCFGGFLALNALHGWGLDLVALGVAMITTSSGYVVMRASIPFIWSYIRHHTNAALFLPALGAATISAFFFVYALDEAVQAWQRLMG